MVENKISFVTGFFPNSQGRGHISSPKKKVEVLGVARDSCVMRQGILPRPRNRFDCPGELALRLYKQRCGFAISLSRMRIPCVVCAYPIEKFSEGDSVLCASVLNSCCLGFCLSFAPLRLSRAMLTQISGEPEIVNPSGPLPTNSSCKARISWWE